MKNSFKPIFIIISALSVFIASSCTKSESLCTSDDATGTTISLIKDQIEKNAEKKIKDSADPSGNGSISISSVRALLSQLKFSIENIRTTKSDPNSSKKFCTGSVKVVLPVSVLNDAETARSAMSIAPLSKLIEDANAQRSADYIKFDLDYDVQPSDDGKTMFSESEVLEPKVEMLSEIIQSAAVKSKVMAAQASQQEQAQQAQAAQIQAAQAEHAQAVQDDQLSQQAIGAAWKTIDPTVRTNILPQQKAWIAEKNANCQVQGTSASTDHIAQDTAKLKCDATENNSRIDWLKQFMTQ